MIITKIMTVAWMTRFAQIGFPSEGVILQCLR